MSKLSTTLDLVGDRPPEEIIRRLALDINRRLDGMLHGDYMGIVPGRGSEPGEAREYMAGDDVRHIDWNVTARMQDPHIRETIADRELETWILVDRSPSLDFGTASCEKRDLAMAAAAGVGLMTARGANRVGTLLLDGTEVTTSPPAQGRKNLLAILDRIARTPRSDGTGPADLDLAFRRLGAIAPRRGLIVVISDFMTDPSLWQNSLGALGMRHSVLCIETVDPWDLELPRIGLVQFRDPSTNTVREINTRSEAVRDAYGEHSAAQRAAIRRAIRSAGADHLTLRTDRDWLMDLANHVTRRRRSADSNVTRRRR